jgi:hypothetical protein
MSAAEREAWLDRLCAQDDDPSDAPQEYWDPESCAPPPGQDELTADELAGIREAAAADEVLAADQRISWWAGELKRAGLEGGMDELRARAFLDLVLGTDSRPRAPQAAGTAGTAGRVTLTVPLATLLGLDQRPGEIPGIGPIDPWLAADLAAAARGNAAGRTGYCPAGLTCPAATADCN